VYQILGLFHEWSRKDLDELVRLMGKLAQGMAKEPARSNRSTD